MKYTDFARGEEFYTAAGKWLCTDVGSRVIVAISLEPREMVRSDVGPDGEPRESRYISSDPNDLNGPPYGVVEHVFDEYDFGGCYASREEARERVAGVDDSVTAAPPDRRARPNSRPYVHLEQIAELDVSAASGLVALADRLCLVADDEHFLASYDYAGRPLSRLALFADALPSEPAQRKPRKADLEALARLPGERLLALGSGSTARRTRGAVFDLGSTSVQTVDLAPLYDALRARLPELNIEGAAVLAGRLWLAHRGNGAARQNALIELDLEAIESLLRGAPALAPGCLRAIYDVTLGELLGVPLGLTDLAPVPGIGLVFCATAEDSPDTYRDGVCTGSALGVLDSKGRVRRISTVGIACKLEGLAIAPRSRSESELWLVADPDDRALRAPLFRVADAGALWHGLRLD